MNKQSLQHYILFDIDSSSIGVLVFERNYESKTKSYHYHQVFTERKKINPAQNTDVDVFFQKTISVFKYLAEKAHIQSGNKIADIYLNISAPWVSSQKRVIHYEKNKEFTIDKELIDSLIEKELNISLHKTHDFKDHSELEIIERRTVDFFVNGYPTKNPYHLLAKDIDIHSLIAVMSSETKTAFTHVIEKVFHHEPHFISNNFMVYQSLISLFPNENNITSLDISGEITEISIIIDDHIKKIGTIPVGEYTVIRHLAQGLNIPFQKAESLIILSQDNNLEEKYKQSIELTMQESFNEWFKYFYEFLDNVSKEYLIPETLSVLAPTETQSWFYEWILRTEELAQHVHAQKNIRILDLKMLFSEKKQLELLSIKDDNLAICLSFIEKELGTQK